MKTNFELESGEVLIERVQRHWFIFLLESVGLVFVAFAPLILIPFLPKEVLAILSDSILIFYYSLWLLFVWVAFFVLFTDYYLDVWVITTKRVVNIEQTGLFNRTSTSCFISKIQDIEIKVEGILATLLGFGKIKIHTAGAEKAVLMMDNIALPQRVKEVITRLQHAEKLESV